jgi:hypothetical protein
MTEVLSLGRGVFELFTDSTRFDKGMDESEKKVGRLQGTFNKGATAARIFGGVLASSVVGELSDAANAAAQDEANVLKLKQAVENAGDSWEDNIAIIEERIRKGQDLAFTDTQTRDSLALLVAQTGSLEEGLKRQSLAYDLARGTGMDLIVASKLLGKVTDENVNVLAKYGINVEKGSDATALFAAVQQKFGGQAEVYGKTTAASIFKVKDSVDEWKESIGASLGPAQGLIGLLPGVSSGMQLAGGAIGAVTPKLGELTGSLASNVGGWQSLGSTLVKGGLVLGALVLVVEALIQVKETADVVAEHWDLFVYALRTGKLNDIPVFGFFFGKAQAVLGLLENIKRLWDLVSGAFSGGGGAAATSAANPNGYPAGYEGYVPVYQEGTRYVPRTGLAVLHEGEAVIRARDNASAAVDRPIVIQLDSRLEVDGRELARANARSDNDVSRRFGIAFA